MHRDAAAGGGRKRTHTEQDAGNRGTGRRGKWPRLHSIITTGTSSGRITTTGTSTAPSGEGGMAGSPWAAIPQVVMWGICSFLLAPSAHHAPPLSPLTSRRRRRGGTTMRLVMTWDVMGSVGAVCRRWRRALMDTALLWQAVDLNTAIPLANGSGSTGKTPRGEEDMDTSHMDHVMRWMDSMWKDHRRQKQQGGSEGGQHARERGTATRGGPTVCLTLPDPRRAARQTPAADAMVVTREHMRHMRRLCPGLRELVIPGRVQMDDGAVTQIMQRFVKQRLQQNNNKNVDENDEQHASRSDEVSVPGLEKLVLADAGLCTSLSDASVLARSHTESGMGVLLAGRLRELVINHCPSEEFTSRSIVELVTHCKKLRVLSVKWCSPQSRLSTQDVEEMAQQGATSLRVLMVEMEEHVDSASMNRLWKSTVAQDLQVLHLRGWQSMRGTDVTWLLRRLRNLRELCIVGGDSQTRWIGPRIESASLQRLEVSHVGNVHRMELGWCPQLREVCWDGVGMIRDVSISVEHFDNDFGNPDMHNVFHDWRDCYAMTRRCRQMKRRVQRENKRQMQWCQRRQQRTSPAHDQNWSTNTPELRRPSLETSVVRDHLADDALINEGGEEGDDDGYESRYHDGVWDLWECGRALTRVMVFKLKSCKFGNDADLQSMIEWADFGGNDGGSHLQQLELFDCNGVSSIRMARPAHLSLSQASEASDTDVCSAAKPNHFSALKTLSLFMCSDLEEVILKCEQLNDLKIDACMDLRKLTVRSPLLQSCSLFRLPQPQFPALQELRLECGMALDTINLQRCVNMRILGLRCAGLRALNTGSCKMLEEIYLQCPQMTKLALCGPRMPGPLEWTLLSEQCPSVTMLSLSNVRSLDDNGMERLCNSSWGKQLNALVIAECPGLTRPTIRFPRLRGLQVVSCQQMKDLSLDCAMLTKLVVRKVPLLGNGFLASLSRKGQLLQSLELMECDKVDIMGRVPVSDMVRVVRCHQLREMSIVQQLPGVKSGSREQKIFLEDCDTVGRISVVGDQGGVLHIVQCPSLKEVSCSNFRIFVEQGQQQQQQQRSHASAVAEMPPRSTLV